MSENTEIWNLNALCRCCHKDGYFKSLHDTFINENEVEVYAQMLWDTFNFEVQQPLLEASNTICDECILRLRDASQFKKQVQACERKFEVYCKNELASNGVEPVKIEVDPDCDTDFNNEEFEFEIDCKNNHDLTKKEENDFDAPYVKHIKSEDEEDVKSTIQIEFTPVIKTDAKGNEQKKKRVRKKIKSEKKSKYDASLEVHVKTESGTLYSCKLCGGSYEQHKEIQKHIILNHKTPYKCMYCEKKFTTTALRAAHVRTHSDDKFKCSYCEKSFNAKYTLKLHENTHTKTEIFKCDLCLKDFAYKQSLKIHLRGHYGTKRKFVCHICGNGFNDKTNLGSHIKTVHEKLRPFACEMCPKTFTAKKHLTVHIRKHTGETPFECDQCEKKFESLGILNNHKQKSHQKKGPNYVCKVCRRRWFDKSLFVKHLRKAHIGQRPYKCTECDKDFVCKYSMKRHVEQHSGVKSFECEQCGAKFSQKGALKRHAERKHVVLEEKVSEKCDVCNKNVFDLKKHMLCHNNKRFSCEYCGKSYSENNVLTRHKKVVHFGIKPHVCEYCDKKYVKINSLRNHQMKVHKIVSKVENDEDFSEVAKFSIKNRKGKIKTEDGEDDISFH
ncbi:hypothetical protein ABMA28_011415 [Loxostege sticticalis]|uniref:Uncharacterized protein n=1 Tax=Loxostege sticticalis TaxID=481309 RepID=A0ABD0S7A4_LOXSC